ncbi:repressor LexA [Clostridiaceae bacterium UIB06]|uniref:DNA 3'-5' helicase n=1 Tax=Clostridium thailandense TaxID=2794346 RepID=A0A949X4C3_9CLOT|nr:transcriptional repressor LexA [Clostridium thailandense]MBV7273768.1 repressor LexA [Clostridium thailandense]MCH5137452.1 repressor LexA [Clostridiaceae bacterium UIB06]
MQLNVEQKKLVQSKPSGHSLIRGVAGSGKTTVAVNRIPFLLNHYCFEADDKILIVTFNKTLVNYIKYIYEKVQDEDKIEFQSLFSIDKSKVEIYTIDKIIYDYYKIYIDSKRLNYKTINNNIKYNLINQAIAELSKVYIDVSILDIRNSKFLLDEVEWIKACNYMELEEYQSVDRMGRAIKKGNESPQKLMKNSRTREAIFNLMLLYRKKLKSEGYLDFQDMALIALYQVKKSSIKKYTHIIVDESQDLTRVQLEFLKHLQLEKEYSSFMFVADNAQSIYTHSWLVKGRSFSSIGFDMKGKSNILAKSYRTTTQISQAAYSLIEKDSNVVEDDNFVKPSLIDKQGTYPIYRRLLNEEEQAAYVANQIRILSKNYKYKDIVVVAKNKNLLENMNSHLNKAKIPNVVVGKSNNDFDSEEVKLLTMHSIKGLEFKVVMLIALNEGVIPYLSYSDPEEQAMQESMERKLLYVGMTRATEQLYLTSSSKPSRFIEDINSKYLRIKDRCRLSKFYNINFENYDFTEELVDLYSNEEKVRQWLLKELQENYKYPKDLLKVEYKINNFSKIGSADICVQTLSSGTELPYIIAEVKPLGSPLVSALSQLKSYMSNCSSCQYGIATNGSECIIINKDFENVGDIPEFNINMLPQSLESRKYVDLKHGKDYMITSDSEVIDEISVKEDGQEVQYAVEDLISFKIYSSIAAGIPIFMNSQCEDILNLPKHWFNSSEEYFVLKVKGDSMIGAGIDNGDMVVIKRQETAENRDIVAAAVDSENATLKRFVKMGDSVLLMPENDKYEPIQIRSDEAKVMGIAVGVVKR